MERFLRAVAAEFASHDLDVARKIADQLAAVAGHEPTPCLSSPGPYSIHLATALSALHAHPLATDLARISPHLNWIQDRGFAMQPGFRGRYAFCEIAGPEGLIPAPDFRFGAYLQFPDTWYPLHSHAAEELYFILSGTALWTRDKTDSRPEPPGTLIRHASFEGHATRTSAQPLLAFWAWHGDIDFASYRIEGG
jgi:Dimethlysulfonioproprionate lyase